MINFEEIIKSTKEFDRLSKNQKITMGVFIIIVVALSCFFQWFRSTLKNKEEDLKHKNKLNEMEQKKEMDKEKIAYSYKKAKEAREEKEMLKSARINNAQAGIKNEDDFESSDIISLGELKKSSLSENNEYLIGSLFPKRGIILLAGEKGLGKTGWLMNAMFQVAGVEGCEIFPSEINNSTPQFVLYYDYELTKSQFAQRYMNLKANNRFRWCHPKYFTYEYLLKQIKYDLDAIHNNDVTIVVDNVTKIDGMSFDSIAKAFYHGLETIRDDYFKKGVSITFILVTHVELKRKAYHAVGKSDIKGASKFINFADSVILIGKSCFESSILVKIENNRNGYESNGKAYLFNRSGEPYLHYNYCGEFNESDLLPKKSGKVFSLSSLETLNNLENVGESLSVKPKCNNHKTKITKDVCLAMLDERRNGISKNQVARDFKVTRQAYNKALKRYGLVDSYSDLPIESSKER